MDWAFIGKDLYKTMQINYKDGSIACEAVLDTRKS